MKSTIEVSDLKEAKLIRAGLSDPATRALVKVMGALRPLESGRAKRRTLQFVADHLDEQQI